MRGLSATAELLVIIRSLLQTKIICPQTSNTSPIICCRITLKKMQPRPHTLIHRNCWINLHIAVHAIVSLLLQSRKFWWYLILCSSALLHGVIMTLYVVLTGILYTLPSYFTRHSSGAAAAAIGPELHSHQFWSRTLFTNVGVAPPSRIYSVFISLHQNSRIKSIMTTYRNENFMYRNWCPEVVIVKRRRSLPTTENDLYIVPKLTCTESVPPCPENDMHPKLGLFRLLRCSSSSSSKKLEF